MTHSCPTRRSSDLKPHPEEARRAVSKGGISGPQTGTAIFSQSRTPALRRTRPSRSSREAERRSNPERTHHSSGSAVEYFTCRRAKLDLMLDTRSEEHTSELQSLMRTSYAVFCLKKKTHIIHRSTNIHEK